MSQQSDPTSPALLLASDVVEVMSGHPEWQIRAQFITDQNSSFLYLHRLIIEPSREGSTMPRPITAKVLKDARIGALQELGEALLRARGDIEPEGPPATGATPGRKIDTWDDYTLARLARDYSTICQRTDQPFVSLTRLWPSLSQGALRTAIKLSRTRGMLSTTQPGKAGGALTAKASRILRTTAP